MSYRIVWSSQADDALIDLWIAGPNRIEISESVDRLEETLRRDPNSAGESRGGISRVIFRDLVAASVQIDDSRKVVFVEDLWRIR